MLGRLIRPDDRRPAHTLLDPLRLALLDALFTRAAAARRRMAEGDASGARAELAPAAWIELFLDAADEAARQCLEGVDRRLRAAALRSRMPPRRAVRHAPTAEDRQVFANRCRSACIPLEQIEPPGPAAPWSAALLRLAGALEEAWTELGRLVASEQARWERDAARVDAWRRPRGLLWAITAAALLAALALGLAIGGYLPAPGGLGTLRDWWWSLPWP
jgi:hypothetical protein